MTTKPFVALLACLLILGTHHSLTWAQGTSSDGHFHLSSFPWGRLKPAETELVFLLDRSGSVGKAGFERQLGFVRSFLNFFEVAPNASRVAVISFSDDAKVHADLLKEPGNRCQLELHLQDASYEKHHATNTGAGLQAAIHVFSRSRNHAPKVLVLVTDGLQTMGPDPVAEAKRLKDAGVEIFVFGIGRSLANALHALASSEDHVYEFESFSEFEKTYDEDQPGDQPTMVDSPRKCDHLCRSPYRGLPDDPGCCDKNAHCGCSLTDGLSNCRCKPGYTGNGRIGECTPCRPGRYKSTSGSDKCLSCPANSSTAHEGSSSLKDCVCKEGYKGNPGARVPCSLVQCPPLQAPAHGRMWPCRNLYGDECTFECNEQYKLESDDSEIRTCQIDGTWSGTTAVCTEIQCDKPQDLENGDVSDCDSPWRVNDTCTLRCHVGYTPRDPRKITCLEGGTWSENDATCKPVPCPPPPAVANSRDRGSLKSRKSYKYLDHFVPECLSGFRVKGPALLYCNEQGRWVSGTQDHTTPTCVDVTPPQILCPPDITVDTQKGKSTARVVWGKPHYKDNDETGLVLQQNPLYESGQELPIGAHRISFRVVDRTRHEANCTFIITVRDKESPMVLSCPPDISLKTTEDEIRVTWDEPQFFDNSGQQLTVRKNSHSGTLFKHGEHNVIYKATDRSNNEATCAFKVKVSRSECPFYPAPQNGALSCDMWMYGQFCQPFCNEYFDFIEDPADWYICAKDLRWHTTPEGMSVPWPDCARRSSPTQAKRAYHARYYSGDCRSHKAQEAIRRAFSENFRNAMQSLPVCTSGNACRLQDVVVTCGNVTQQPEPISVRLRRSARSVHAEPAASIAGVDAEVVLKMAVSGTGNGTFVNDTEELAAVVDEILDGISEITPSVLKRVSDEENVSVRMDLIGYTADEMVIVCAEGETIKGQGCAKCPKGTFHDKSQGRCSPCPVGSYQDEDGAVSCKPCPKGAATATPKSDSVADCQPACSPGTYSMSGLETCLACPVGTYQNDSQQTRCKPCPTGSSTEAFGSRNVSDCKKYCVPGTHSDTGLQPCLPCERGSYQAQSGRKSCDQCPAPRTTLKEGSQSRFDCVEVDHCASSPCREGTCVAHRHGFTCEKSQEHRAGEVEEEEAA